MKIAKVKGGSKVSEFNVTEIGIWSTWRKNFGTFQYSDFAEISPQRFFRSALSIFQIKIGGQNFSTTDEFK